MQEADVLYQRMQQVLTRRDLAGQQDDERATPVALCTMPHDVSGVEQAARSVNSPPLGTLLGLCPRL